MHKEFRLKTKNVEGLLNWLESLQLESQKSRQRTKFCRILIDYLQTIDLARVELIKTYAKKDKDGKPELILTGDGKKIFDTPPESLEVINKEYQKLVEVDFVLQITKENEGIIKQASKIVLDTPIIFGPLEGDNQSERDLKIKLENDYADWADAFERIESKV